MQDTFHEAMYHLDVLAHHEAPGGWLLVTLKYKLREYERARRRYLLRFLSLDSELARDPVSPAPREPTVGRKQLGPIAAALAAAVALFSHDE